MAKTFCVEPLDFTVVALVWRPIKNMSIDELSSYEEDMKAQKGGVYPAKNHRQEEDDQHLANLFQQFQSDHKELNEEWLLKKYGDEAFGYLLAAMLKWFMRGRVSKGKVVRNSVSLNYFETVQLRKIYLLAQKEFPGLHQDLKSCSVAEVRRRYLAFNEQYEFWSRCVGGSKAECVSTHPAFWVDSIRLIESAEPTAIGIRWKAVISVLAYEGIGIDVL
jgi:hypothetical protein